MTQLRRDTITNTAPGSSAQTEAGPSSHGEHNRSSISRPPTYDECRIAASKSGVNQHPEPGTRWVTIKCKDDFFVDSDVLQQTQADSSSLTTTDAQSSKHRQQAAMRSAGGPGRPAPSLSSLSRRESLPKVPELCQIMSQFEQAQLTLHGQAREMIRTTETLFSLRKELMNIHEYWMDVGMHDMAHDMIPLLDLVEEDMPRYTFPPWPNSAAPVM